MLGFKSATFMPIPLAKEINRLNAQSNNKYPQKALIKAGDHIYQGFCNQFTDEQGNILGSISLFHDVTQQQATQSALEKAKDQAEYANRVKIQFLANMSHEVRTPINAMQGMMDLLAYTLLDTRQQHYLSNAQSASKTLLHLVDELLDLSKIEADKMIVNQEAVNLPRIIDKALKLNMGNVDNTRVEVIVDMSPNVPSNVISDEMRLVQVLANLLNNAIKFTEQGQIKLIIDTLPSRDTEVQVRFCVRDTGIGIASDKQGHLFTAFSQADESMTRKYGGSGLGLSICQQIIKLLGGEISLTSQLNEGSELSFVLPLKRVEFDKQDNKVLINKSNIDEHPQGEGLSSLSAELNKPLIEDVSIYVVNQNLSVSLTQSITQMSWSLYRVNNFDELCQLEVQKNSVLLIDEAGFTEQRGNQFFISHLANFTLLCFCQPALKQVSNDTCDQLDKLSIPYLLADMPLFRYTLDQILQFLVAKNKNKNKNKSEIKGVTQTRLNDHVQGRNKVTSKISDKRSESFLNISHVHNLQDISVLLVEDNLINQLVAKELLLNMDAKVTIADNGLSALDILAEHEFDVVLMDIQMPIMDGLTAAKHIRSQGKYQHLPIIAMTAHAREEDKKQSLAAGMNLHMPKPVTGQVLFSSIKQVLSS
jgi:signal transduction histidine kinase